MTTNDKVYALENDMTTAEVMVLDELSSNLIDTQPVGEVEEPEGFGW